MHSMMIMMMRIPLLSLLQWVGEHSAAELGLVRRSALRGLRRRHLRHGYSGAAVAPPAATHC